MYGTLTREAYFKFGTFGVLEVAGFKWSIAEAPWLNNTPFKSCIPEGSYEICRHNSPTYKECFAIIGEGVGLNEGDAKRWGCLFHPANWPDQLMGCAAPGTSIQPIYSNGREWPQCLGVTQSRGAMQEMLNRLPDIWHLEIRSIKAEYANPKVT